MPNFSKTLASLYLDKMPKNLLTREGEVYFAKLIEQGDEQARIELINSNLRLVISIVKKYRRQSLDFMSLVQEGNIGLMKAVEKFDYKKGYRFSTYATHWIKQSIGKALHEKSLTIRIPVHMQETIVRFRRAMHLLAEERGQFPTPERLAHFLEIPYEKVVRMYDYIENKYLPSLDRTISETSDTTLADFIADETTGAQEQLEEETQKTVIKTILRTLTPKEETVLRMRYSLE